MADRGHQGPARGAAELRGRRRVAAVRERAAGAVNGLQNARDAEHPCATATPACVGGGTANTGGAWSPSPNTASCHDITVYEAIDLAAGACEGNGLLIDISDPANPKRIDAVADPLFAYWHGATFSNDGKAVLFTDEWGGGNFARCRATDQLSWGADAIYEIVNRKLVFRSYYKLPVAQTLGENCVSHVGNLVPVPGRNIMVQAWYQGGISLVDFTDLSQPEGDRRTSTVARSTADRADRRRLLVDVLAQRPHLRLRDRPRLRHVRADARRPTCRRARSPRPSASACDADERPVAGPVRVHLGAGRRRRGRQRAGDAVADARHAGAFGAFTPGVARTYETTTPANVISTAGDALLSVADPSPQNTGHLVNGTFFLPQPLQARARNAANTGTAYNNVGSSASPLNLLTYSGPISNDAVSLSFSQRDQRQRRAAHGHVQQDADVHPVDDAALARLAERRAGLPGRSAASACKRFVLTPETVMSCG